MNVANKDLMRIPVVGENPGEPSKFSESGQKSRMYFNDGKKLAPLKLQSCKVTQVSAANETIGEIPGNPFFFFKYQAYII